MKLNNETLPTYKRTAIGLIPNEWSVLQVSHLGTEERPPVKAGPFGSSLKKEFYVSSGYKIYGQEQVIAGDATFGDYYIDEEKFRDLKSCSVQPGDILMSLVGTIGEVLVVPPGAEPGIINPRLLRLSLDRSRVDITFVQYWLTSETISNLLSRYAQGGTMGVLNAKIVGSVPIVLPPLPEQRKIAEILGTWDEALALLDRRIEAAAQRKQGLMQRLLTGRVRFPEFVGEKWERVALGELGSCIRGVSYKPQRDLRPEDEVGTVRLLRANNIADSRINLLDLQFVVSDRCSDSQLLHHGDVAICMASGSHDIVGKAATFALDDDFTYAVGAFCAIFRTDDKALASYIGHCFQSDDYERGIHRYKAGSSIQNLKPSDIESVRIRVSANPQERARIADVLDTCDREIGLLQRKRELLQEQKKGLMQRLLTGRVRVQP